MNPAKFNTIPAMYRVCSNNHDEVRWHVHGGYGCWFCGAAGVPIRALTITSRIYAIDEEAA